MEKLLLSDILVLAAAGMFVLGYLIINQVILRVMLLIGTALYIWYYFVVAPTPLWPAIWASSATGFANIIGLSGLLLRKSQLSIPRRFSDLYVHFDMLPPGDFRKLMLVAQRRSRPAGYQLTQDGVEVQKLCYVVAGTVTVKKFGNSFTMPGASFVGEVSFLTGNYASASTYLSHESDVLEWDVGMLERRAARDVRFRLALDAVISLDLAQKVARAGTQGVAGARLT
ncbi:cyclic nucleotide-binding domain-containing protein [Aliiroseovarius sp. S1339]|uniref:cyclic nucleotide-binding domain-containing protein n=1 Tax=Aliiroseovarius sp. S1339 TaxID=2936990 RepID=UPI0020BD7FBC|nr:cyclic nucleotide-binding domain-containing protein [Aliiroseovarius sp. S1339]MCK8464442.1 cyclic nucleotide-binding domain-containing protein [Aliiroseovarius sp. S1339]